MEIARKEKEANELLKIKSEQGATLQQKFDHKIRELEDREGQLRLLQVEKETNDFEMNLQVAQLEKEKNELQEKHDSDLARLASLKASAGKTISNPE